MFVSYVLVHVYVMLQHCTVCRFLVHFLINFPLKINSDCSYNILLACHMLSLSRSEREKLEAWIFRGDRLKVMTGASHPSWWMDPGEGARFWTCALPSLLKTRCVTATPQRGTLLVVDRNKKRLKRINTDSDDGGFHGSLELILEEKKGNKICKIFSKIIQKKIAKKVIWNVKRDQIRNRVLRGLTFVTIQMIGSALSDVSRQ